jgi:hypothetical protein
MTLLLGKTPGGQFSVGFEPPTSNGSNMAAKPGQVLVEVEVENDP